MFLSGSKLPEFNYYYSHKGLIIQTKHSVDLLGACDENIISSFIDKINTFIFVVSAVLWLSTSWKKGYSAVVDFYKCISFSVIKNRYPLTGDSARFRLFGSSFSFSGDSLAQSNLWKQHFVWWCLFQSRISLQQN